LEEFEGWGAKKEDTGRPKVISDGDGDGDG